MVNEIGFVGRSLLSVNDLTDDQIYGLFELALILEPFNRLMVPLVTGNVMSTLFFQPSTRTRMSLETAMHRLGGAVISEANPMVTSSAAKEESLSDMLKVVSKYANIIVMRHFNDVDARQAAPYTDSPVINGGWGHWEHPTQALLDLYTLYRTYGRIEGLKVCVASADLIEAHTLLKIMEFTAIRSIGQKAIQIIHEYMTPQQYARIVNPKTPEEMGSIEQFFSLDRDELIRQVDVVPVGSSITSQREVRSQQIMQAQQLLMQLQPQVTMQNNPPFTVNMLEVAKMSLEDLDIRNVDEIIQEQAPQPQMPQGMGQPGAAPPQGGGGVPGGQPPMPPPEAMMGGAPQAAQGGQFGGF